MNQPIKYLLLITFLTINYSFSQEINLFQQFNGRYNYLAIGNTLNPVENATDGNLCDKLTESDADLLLPPNTNVVAAYLYWAGSGEGDQEVDLNGTSIIADDIYLVDYDTGHPIYGTLTYFSCYAEITDFITNTGETTYTLSNLDITETLESNIGYCRNKTDFAGWCIYIIYEDLNLPLNQVKLFQGLEIINKNVGEKTITLDNVNVLDNEGAKIGFLTWEGDSNLAYGESLFINNNLISNPPLNPANNAFNGTNTFTNSNTFYNGDIDVYNIQDNIAIGDTTVDIKLTTGDFDTTGVWQADLIIINNIITVLNSQLPDPTIQINNVQLACGSRDLIINYTVYNINCNDVLPANVPIAIYANNELIGTTLTTATISIGGSLSGQATVIIPDHLPSNFTITLSVDDVGDGTGVITEFNEFNNEANQNVQLLEITLTPLQPLTNCDESFNTAYFDLSTQLNSIDTNGQATSFFETLEDLQNESNEILNASNYQNTMVPQTIYLRVEGQPCYEVYFFDLIVENCPPRIPEVFTPNNDGYNDWFNIQGLYNIFEKHKLLIYNRYGTLIFEGNNESPWLGLANKGLNNTGKILPVGTYFYVLYLNDSNYKTLTGWVYLNR